MRWLVGVLLLVGMHGAQADPFAIFVGVQCLPQRVEVRVERGSDEAKPADLAAPAVARWRTDELRDISSTDDFHYQTTPRPHSPRCQIEGVEVVVLVEPEFAPRWHPVGNCAARTGARVTIHRGGLLVGTEGFDACTESTDVPVAITVQARGNLEVRRVPLEQFLSD